MNVVNFPGPTLSNIEPDKVIGAAMGKCADSVIVIGTTGDKMYFAASMSSKAEILFLLESFKMQLMGD